MLHRLNYIKIVKFNAIKAKKFSLTAVYFSPSDIDDKLTAIYFVCGWIFDEYLLFTWLDKTCKNEDFISALLLPI